MSPLMARYCPKTTRRKTKHLSSGASSRRRQVFFVYCKSLYCRPLQFRKHANLVGFPNRDEIPSVLRHVIAMCGTCCIDQ